jgi:N-acetylglucosamine-6-phosphate deacetylase
MGTIRARYYATGERVEIGCGRVIKYVRPTTQKDTTFGADWVAPSWFDLQVNGCSGITFNSDQLAVDDIHRVAATLFGNGVHGFLPTVITGSREALTHAFSQLALACDTRTEGQFERGIAGFHLEGPYISGEDGPRGAHPKQHVRPPDWDEFRRWQDAAGGRIRLMTLAPELPGALPFIERLVASNVVVSIGHTAAAPEQIRDAVKAGARMSTHLGNGCHALLPRHPNYIWEQLAADELWASVIADGHHLPPSVLKTILRTKTPARTILISDLSSLAGLPPGRHHTWDGEFEVRPEGKVVVPGTNYLAGSAAALPTCVSYVLEHGLATLAEAIDMASVRPRELLGLPVPRIEVGANPSLVLFDWQPGQPLVFKGAVMSFADAKPAEDTVE